MKFLVCRASQGAVSKKPPCKGAIRGEEARAWPGEFPWFVELATLDDLLAFLNETGGALGLFAPDEGEEHPIIEIFDEDEAEDWRGDWCKFQSVSCGARSVSEGLKIRPSLTLRAPYEATSS